MDGKVKFHLTALEFIVDGIKSTWQSSGDPPKMVVVHPKILSILKSELYELFGLNFKSTDSMVLDGVPILPNPHCLYPTIITSNMTAIIM